MAEQAGLARPYRMQSLLGRSQWNEDGLRDAVRAYVIEALGDADGVLIVDETGFVKKGAASVGVARQYLRRAMVRPGRDCLSSEIEVDETYIGGSEEGKIGRQIKDKAIVVIAAEKNGRGIGRIRLRRVVNVSADSLIPFVQTVTVPGSTINTDGWRGYARLSSLGYQHNVTVISAGSDPAHVVMPRVHNVASLLKRWLMGTHQGGIQHQHLDYYLDEFTFRFNRRHSQARGLLFHRLVQQAVAVGPAPYHQIIEAGDHHH